MTLRTYSELMQLNTFAERYEYLALRGVVGDPTFAADRWMNQRFYRSSQWLQMRNYVIVRDFGCDLASRDREIPARPLIHHMNPMSAQDIVHDNADILDPEFLITTTHRTHNAIHYGDASLLTLEVVERRPGDTTLWPSRRRSA